MAEPSIVFLMYHELELPGRATVQSDPGYMRYVLGECDFRTQMQFLKQQSWRGMSVGEALTFPKQPGVAITFDDGCETDFLAAASILEQTGFGGTFPLAIAGTCRLRFRDRMPFHDPRLPSRP